MIHKICSPSRGTGFCIIIIIEQCPIPLYLAIENVTAKHSTQIHVIEIANSWSEQIAVNWFQIGVNTSPNNVMVFFLQNRHDIWAFHWIRYLYGSLQCSCPPCFNCCWSPLLCHYFKETLRGMMMKILATITAKSLSYLSRIRVESPVVDWCRANCRLQGQLRNISLVSGFPRLFWILLLQFLARRIEHGKIMG